MPEDHCLGDACGVSNFLSCSAAKTLLGKQTDSYSKDLKLSILRGHSRSAANPRGDPQRSLYD